MLVYLTRGYNGWYAVTNRDLDNIGNVFIYFQLCNKLYTYMHINLHVHNPIIVHFLFNKIHVAAQKATQKPNGFCVHYHSKAAKHQKGKNHRQTHFPSRLNKKHLPKLS